ncbi:hypothetical protein [Novosphingobium sp. JCM 18896]|uniref:hypothetical protein n=1 Tax=Novosphingobium sp. JCM 18896 TaxID=2989731 RepID=UPI0022238027|nr:hypothetical protein [Novosphingobium sp. JCM 18896]MCW1429796.1 hypothetical protein [Novosphingobium sp. JCM 18896]
MMDEPDRDGDLIRNLGELTPPEVPADLAARIVRNVTALPQQQPLDSPQAETPAAPRRARTKLWLPRAIGAAAAACVIGALLVHVVDLADLGPGAPLPADRPAQAVKVVTGSVEVRLAKASEAPAAPAPVVRKPAKPAPRTGHKHLEPEIMPSDGVPLKVEATPEFAIESSPPIAPVDKPSERELVGPADPHGATGAMPRGGPAPGFGISGSGASMPGPAPY